MRFASTAICFNKRAACAALACLLLANFGHAAQRKINLRQLGNPAADESANDRFRAFARQLALSFSAQPPSLANTLGWFGASAAAFVSFEKPNWTALENATWEAAKIRNREAMGPLFPHTSPLWTQWGLSVRKGLPYSFEVGAHAQWLSQSRLWTLGADLKWAFNEGIDFLPDFSIRLHFQQLFGSKPLRLSTGGLDLSLGKSFALPYGFILGLVGGWDLLFVSASSQWVAFDDGHAKFDALPPFSNAHSRVYAACRLVHGSAFFQGGLSYSMLKTPIPQEAAPPNAVAKLPLLWLLSASFGLGYLF